MRVPLQHYDIYDPQASIFASQAFSVQIASYKPNKICQRFMGSGVVKKKNLGQRRFQVIVLNLERRICMLHVQYSFTEYALICFTRFFLLIDIPSVYSVMIGNCMYTLYSLIKVKLITGLLHVYHHCVLVHIQLASQENENIAVLYSSLILLFFSYIERNVNNGITVIFCYLNTC